uniref:Uncharacterized protein n=1 Tax=Acrobeloides nanus TaxID=290746 RepID=A0A914DFT6_9BILA
MLNMNNVGEDSTLSFTGSVVYGFLWSGIITRLANNCPSCPICSTHPPCHCQRQRPCPTRFPSTNPSTSSTIAASNGFQFEGLVNESIYEQLYLKHEVIVT